MPAKKNPAGGGAAEEMSFETALDRLRDIVDDLERGELTLDESIARYEEGMTLSKRLTQQLDAAEQRIQRLLEPADETSPPTTRAMELDATSTGPSEGELPF